MFLCLCIQVSLPEIRGWKYNTKDNRLCIYACDFFSVTPQMIGEVDAVYDRGALEAINVNDRQGYVKLMQSLLGKNFRLHKFLASFLDTGLFNHSRISTNKISLRCIKLIVHLSIQAAITD